MTLHDLSASDNLDSITSEVFYNEIRLLQIMKDHPHKPQTIRMKTNFVINMVSTSLVLALVPADEAEWNKLQTLYDLINEVMICPYPYLTPHITLKCGLNIILTSSRHPYVSAKQKRLKHCV